MKSSVLPFVCAFLLATAALPRASPLRRAAEIVWNPSILYPTEGVVWVIGETQDVTWSTDGMPPGLGSGRLLLGHPTNDSENLFDTPLAQDFDLAQQSVTFTVPTVDPDSGYVVVLMGDSGNESPQFQIVAPGAGGYDST